MGLGIRNGMSGEVRKALREKLALAVRVGLLQFSNPCQKAPYPEGRSCESGGSAPAWMSESDKRIFGKLKGSVQADFLAQAEAAYKKKNGKKPPGAARAKAKPKVAAPAVAAPAVAPAGLLDARRKYIVDKKGWQMFDGEVGDLVGRDVQVRQRSERVWVSRTAFLKLRGPAGETALERYAQRDLHGMVVERGGRYLDPFATGHVAARLEQFDMAAGELDGGGLVGRVRGGPAFSVELKGSAVMPSGVPRAKNRIYLLEGSGAKAVALNVVVRGSDIQTAIVEFADGSFADMGAVRRALGPRTNTVIKVEDFERSTGAGR